LSPAVGHAQACNDALKSAQEPCQFAGNGCQTDTAKIKHGVLTFVSSALAYSLETLSDGFVYNLLPPLEPSACLHHMHTDL